MKHNVEVVLVVVSPDLHQRGNARFLLFERGDGKVGLPMMGLRERWSTLQEAAYLLDYCTGIKARVGGEGWAELVPCPLADSPERLVDGERRIAAPYGVMLPGEIVQLTCDFARWAWLSEAPSLDWYMDHKDILTAVCGRL